MKEQHKTQPIAPDVLAAARQTAAALGLTLSAYIERRLTMTTQTRIWAHVRSGEKYAVQIDEAGNVISAAGPLHHSEIVGALAGDWNHDPDVTEDIAADAFDYQDVTEDIAADAFDYQDVTAAARAE